MGHPARRPGRDKAGSIRDEGNAGSAAAEPRAPLPGQENGMEMTAEGRAVAWVLLVASGVADAAPGRP